MLRRKGKILLHNSKHCCFGVPKQDANGREYSANPGIINLPSKSISLASSGNFTFTGFPNLLLILLFFKIIVPSSIISSRRHGNQGCISQMLNDRYGIAPCILTITSFSLASILFNSFISTIRMMKWFYFHFHELSPQPFFAFQPVLLLKYHNEKESLPRVQ